MHSMPSATATAARQRSVCISRGRHATLHLSAALSRAHGMTMVMATQCVGPAHASNPNPQCWPWRGASPEHSTPNSVAAHIAAAVSKAQQTCMVMTEYADNAGQLNGYELLR